MSWRGEFGEEWDVPEASILGAVSGIEDQSWHNDACPSFGVRLVDPPSQDVHDLRLWVDHADPGQRELGGGLYIVNYQPWSAQPVPGVTVCDYGDLYCGDDLDAALDAFRAAQAAIEAEIAKRVAA